MKTIRFSGCNIQASVNLPWSKSWANRQLVLQALAGKKLMSPSDEWPRDVIQMHKALSSTEKEIDVKDAGTVMRFCTAYFACQHGERILKGRGRMHKRPIGILVEALQNLGADIEYLGENGFPPLKIKGSKLNGGKIEIPANVSSQFVSALLMIAPMCKERLEILLEGKIVSEPYIKMTMDLLRKWGIQVLNSENSMLVEAQSFHSAELEIERDWSAAAFIFQILALSDGGEIQLNGLAQASLQGDQKCLEFFKKLGIGTEYNAGGLRIAKKMNEMPVEVAFDFSRLPDFFQAAAMTCIGLGIELHATGLFNLHLKESNRIQSVQSAVEMLGGEMKISENSVLIFPPETLPEKVNFKSFDDHRMAMSIAPLSMKISNVSLDDVEVVQKSFPGYWMELEKMGIRLVENG